MVGSNDRLCRDSTCSRRPLSAAVRVSRVITIITGVGRIARIWLRDLRTIRRQNTAVRQWDVAHCFKVSAGPLSKSMFV